MLQIKNVSKTYCPKKGVPVKALDDVSLDFADRGMVFILGKSGSGKSTLLNVLGGLDRADSGEFIIKGKSNRDFSQADFDSYRNTFIGFIFQEYNVLGEFTVAQNIALAMELQGKRATNEELSAILDEVDLSGYGNRKPNELSGGQKQRVAIARALIKSPEMIMADEPTGALDSNTGKQVFDTLKKLSREKLVLIVSHDRDFAEIYADRIIELKDGKIISDVSKKSIPPIEHSPGVSIVDDKLIQIKQGYSLTEADLKLINEYISRAASDTIISVDSEKSEEIKKAVKINDKGGKDAFLNTSKEDITQKTYKPEDSTLIRSKLPYKNSLKIGASSLRAKPVRLIFTVLLCFIAFTLFGLADTLAAYNKAEVLYSSIKDRSIPTISFEKYVEISSYTEKTYLSENDITKIKTETGIDVLPVFGGVNKYSSGFSLSSVFVNDDNLDSPNGTSLYNGKIAGYAELTEEFLADNNASLVSGRLPTADHEIAISKFIFDQFKTAGIIYYDEINDVSVSLSAHEIVDYSSVIGKLISGYNLEFPSTNINEKKQQYVKIVGVYDTNFDTSEYADYLPDAQRKEASMLSSISALKISAARDYGLHTVVAVNSGMLEKLIDYSKTHHRIENDLVGIDPGQDGGSLVIEKDHIGHSPDNILKLSMANEVGQIIWVDGARTSLSNEEVILPLIVDYDKRNLPLTQNMINRFEQTFNLNLSDSERQELSRLNIYSLTDDYQYMANYYIINDVPKEYACDFVRSYFGLAEGEEIIDRNGFSGSVEDYVASTVFAENEFTYALDEYRFDIFNEFYAQNPYDSSITGNAIKTKLKAIAIEEAGSPNFPDNASMRIISAFGDERVNFNAVGFFIPNDNYEYSMFVSDEIYGKFGIIERGDYSFAIGKMPLNSPSELRYAVDFSLKSDNKCIISIQNESAAILNYIGNIIETLAQVFLYIDIGFAFFASLMMFNFISVSVSFKKREIGILRAVGARSSDVFGIFLNESLIITAMNFTLSAVATGVVSAIINGVFRGYGLPVTVLNFGIRQILLLLGVGVLVAFVGSFFPVMNIAKKRPIDAIQNR